MSAQCADDNQTCHMKTAQLSAMTRRSGWTCCGSLARRQRGVFNGSNVADCCKSAVNRDQTDTSSLQNDQSRAAPQKHDRSLSLSLSVYSVSHKKPEVFLHFSHTVGHFSSIFTHILYVPIYARLQICIQLFPTLTYCIVSVCQHTFTH